MIFDENILGTNLLNSSFGLLHSDQFYIYEEYGSTIPFYGVSTGPVNSTHESTGSQFTLDEDVNTPTNMADNHQPEPPLNCLPW